MLDDFLDVVAVTFVGASGDHLADESGEEKKYSEDDCYQSKVEQRLVCNGSVVSIVSLMDQLCDYDP